MLALRSPEARILDVYKANKIQPDAHKILEHALRNRPPDVADAFRHLHRERMPLHGEAFRDAFDRVTVKLVVIVSEQLHIDDTRFWKAVISSDLLEAHIDVVCDDAFFSESPDFIDRILQALSCIILGTHTCQAAKPSTLGARGFERLWLGYLWDN